MPRIVYDPSAGSDVSSSVQAGLLAKPSTLRLCNLYTFANRNFWSYDPNGNCALWTFTDADFPVSLDYLQLFASGSVAPTALNGGNILALPGPAGTGITYRPRIGLNDGGWKHSQLVYEVGLAAHDVDVTWFLDDTTDYFAPLSGAYPSLINPPVAVLPMKQAMAYYHAFDDCPFWIHRATFSPYQPIWAGSCIGCFTDGTGQIVATPFLVGLGVNITVPPGATQLQMGVTDLPYSDNTGSWTMNVNGTNYTVNGTAAPWVYVSGGLNNAYSLPSSGQTSPTVVSGLTAGQNVAVYYVTGLTSLHFGVPLLTANGWPGNVYNYYSNNVPGFYAVSTTSTGSLYLSGTTLMYRGFIRKVEAAADYLKISLGSLLQILQDTPVPNQIIQANTRNAPFLPFPNLGLSTLGPWPSAGTITRLSAKTYTFAGTGITADQLQDCWVTFNPSSGHFNFAPPSGFPPPSSPGWRIQSNTASSGGSVNVTFYDPPIVPGNVQNVNLFSPSSQTVGAPGFEFIPPPENSI